MDIQLLSFASGSAASCEVPEGLFSEDYKGDLVHQLVVSYQSNGRSGTKKLKNRSAVSGGGAKPWRQKGTGRARAGTSRSPLWRGGGVTFTGVTNYKKKLNRKMYRVAMRMILSQLYREDRLLVCDQFQMDEPKTKLAIERIQGLGIEAGSRVLFVLSDVDIAFIKSVRNIPNVMVLLQTQLDPVTLISAEKIVFSQAALSHLGEVYV